MTLLPVLLVTSLMVLSACSTAARKTDNKPREPVALPDKTPGVSTWAETGNRFILHQAGILTDPRAAEVSGLAVSGLSSNRLWMVNDSGNDASLLAYSLRGEFQAAVPVTASNRDWEALAGFRLGDDAYLMVADTGDNLRAHAHYTLSLFLEPDISSPSVTAVAPQPLKPLSVIRFVYPDGKHNCEAVAVSTTDSSIILVTKSSTSPGIYTLPLLLESNDTILTATRVGTLPPLPKSLGDHLLERLVGVDLSQATGLDIDEEGGSAFLLTYRGIFRWIRESKEQDWGTVLSRMPVQLTRHSLAQAEALAFSHDNGSVYVVSEKTPSPILTLDPLIR